MRIAVALVLGLVILVVSVGCSSDPTPDVPNVIPLSEAPWELTPKEQASLTRWKERDVHWDRIDNFVAMMTQIQEDSVTTIDEANILCDTAGQWKGHFQEAITYVNDYEQADPEFVAKNPTITNLRSEANRHFTFISEVAEAC